MNFKSQTSNLKSQIPNFKSQISNLEPQTLIYDTTLEINLKHLIANLNYFKSLLLPKTKIMVMVKAFSYGLGTYEVAKTLEENKVGYLGVANIYEGIELRKAGINLPIMVMKPELESFELMLTFKLSPTIFSPHSLMALLNILKKNKKLIAKTPVLINLKIDTGMHRLGFSQEEIPVLLTLLKENSFLKIESIYSHLAASDEKKHDNFTNQQIEKFTQISKIISNEFKYPIDKHILNSNGIIRFNEAQMDMVRLGIGLYGISPNQNTQHKLLSVSTLKSKIAQIKSINKGETIGYGRNGAASKKLKIATIPLGYADGLNRKLGNGNWQMLVNGKKAPTIGNVCMDMVMIDVSNIKCKEGDEVIVFGDKNPITEIAKQIKTIPYEVLTAYSPRVKRVFKS